MFSLSAIASLCLAATVVSAQHDNTVRLEKPPLLPSLDVLKDGLLNHLPEHQFTVEAWAGGWMPEHCKTIADGGVFDDVTFNPADFQIFNVRYEDCGDPWVFCHHKDSPITVESMARQFGKVPIQMREWVRHVVDMPAEAGWAFEWAGTVAFFNPSEDFIGVILHEVGHSLDLEGAYKDKPLSASNVWWDNYNLDTNVADNYGATNAIESVAQITTIAVFNENVPGKFESVEPNWSGIFHQYATLITQAREVGEGNTMLTPGQGAQCTQRMPPTAPVSIGGAKRSFLNRRMPNVKLSDNVKHIHGNHKRAECKLTW